MTRKNQLRVAVYAALALLVLFFVLHPYTRQTVLGPRIRNIPFAYWRDEFRFVAAPSEYRKSMGAKLMAFVGIQRAHVSFPRGPDMLPVLLSLGDDGNDFVRARVARDLADHPDSDEACDLLLRMLDDPGAVVRGQAAHTVAAVPPAHERALPKLRACLEDEDTLCRYRAAYAVCCIVPQPDAAALAVLRNGLHAAQQQQRIQAIWLVASLVADKKPQALEMVAEAIKANPTLIHEYCTLLLNGGPATTPLLVDMLGSADREVRQCGAFLLGELGPRAEVAIPALVEALNDREPDVRRDARMALSRIDPKRYPPEKTKKRN